MDRHTKNVYTVMKKKKEHFDRFLVTEEVHKEHGFSSKISQSNDQTMTCFAMVGSLESLSDELGERERERDVKKNIQKRRLRLRQRETIIHTKQTN